MKKIEQDLEARENALKLKEILETAKPNHLHNGQEQYKTDYYAFISNKRRLEVIKLLSEILDN